MPISCHCHRKVTAGIGRLRRLSVNLRGISRRKFRRGEHAASTKTYAHKGRHARRGLPDVGYSSASDEVLQRTEMSRRARGGSRERRSKGGARNERPVSDGQRREGWSAARYAAQSALRCPIYDCVYKGLSLTDRI